MRSDESIRNIVSNGNSNGSAYITSKKTSVSLNGHSPIRNGSHHNHTNGTLKKQIARSRDYRGHSREELTRILIQGLKDMGYEDSAQTLSVESGYELESNEVFEFRQAILEGRWLDAEAILVGSYPDEGGGLKDALPSSAALTLAEHASRPQMLFWIREQKYLELLVNRNLLDALKVLREELMPLEYDTHRLHQLSSLLMCTQKELQDQNKWPRGASTEGRSSLLQHLTQSIAPSVMIRDHRLAELLDQVKEAQINRCMYHNTASPPSLYSDHICNRADFPSRTWMILDDHTGEVYCVQFSPDGKWLATAGEDRVCYVYSVVDNFEIKHKLRDCTAAITHIAWSPNSEFLAVCSMEPQAHIFDATTGKKIMTIKHNESENRPITACGWLPGSRQFITGSHDRTTKMVLWSLDVPDLKNPRPIYQWSDELRVTDLAITPDGRRLVCNNMYEVLIVYNLETRQEEYRHRFSSKVTSIVTSQNSPTVLVNLAEGEVNLMHLDKRTILRKFKGQKQGSSVIRSCFGGASENFVLSGSEDGRIYIWHKENSALIETLRGHGKGSKQETCVTSVSWNPVNWGMFASAGDDRKVRIWANFDPDDSDTGFHPPIRHPDLGRTSAIRSTSNL